MAGLQEGTMEEGRFSPKRHWVSLDKRQECLALFQEGNGTVRDYRRRYAQGDDSWAYRERV